MEIATLCMKPLGETFKTNNNVIFTVRSQSFLIFPDIVQYSEITPVKSNLVYYMATPRAGKMNQILRCDWLPERARWSSLARSELPVTSRKKNFHEIHMINPMGY